MLHASAQASLGDKVLAGYAAGSQHLPHPEMNPSTALDLAGIRLSCAHCSLQQLCLPAGLGQEDLERLDRVVRRRRRLSRGERLFHVGSSMDCLYVAREGSFKTVTINDEGAEQIICFHLPGELIGLDALGSGVHRCEAEALTSAQVCEVSLSVLSEVSRQLPDLQTQILRVIGRSMDRDQDHMTMLGKRQAQERIAMFLHSLSERFRLLNQPHVEFNLPMSREDIANYLGLVIETVSRGFTRLQDEGVIKARGRQVRILDAAELTFIAHGGAHPPRSHTANTAS